MGAFPVFSRALIPLVFLCDIVYSGDYKADTTLNGMRVELHLLPAEQFFTKDQVSAGKAKEGMVIMNGAEPLLLDAETKPTHHLAIHVIDSLTTKAITNAKVEMSYQSLDEKGEQSGNPVEVPVVVMQSIGKDEESTHYGNNVIMRDGPYVVSVFVNGKKLKFKIDRFFEPNPSMEPGPSRAYRLTH
jgi:hypothetical protein